MTFLSSTSTSRIRPRSTRLMPSSGSLTSRRDSIISSSVYIRSSCKQILTAGPRFLHRHLDVRLRRRTPALLHPQTKLPGGNNSDFDENLVALHAHRKGTHGHGGRQGTDCARDDVEGGAMQG